MCTKRAFVLSFGGDLGDSRDMKNTTAKVKMLITRGFSEITPESAEQGDFSDSGTMSIDEPMTFRDLVDAIRRDGFFREGWTGWLTTGFITQDYYTMTEREETLHFSRNNPARLEKYFWLALKAASK